MREKIVNKDNPIHLDHSLLKFINDTARKCGLKFDIHTNLRRLPEDNHERFGSVYYHEHKDRKKNLKYGKHGRCPCTQCGGGDASRSISPTSPQQLSTKKLTAIDNNNNKSIHQAKEHQIHKTTDTNLRQHQQLQPQINRTPPNIYRTHPTNPHYVEKIRPYQMVPPQLKPCPMGFLHHHPYAPITAAHQSVPNVNWCCVKYRNLVEKSTTEMRGRYFNSLVIIFIFQYFDELIRSCFTIRLK